MTSCGGTSSTTVRSDILIMRSIGQNRKKMPGPLACGSTRPRRKITARSYSLSTRIQRETRKTTRTKMIGSAESAFIGTSRL